MGFQQYLLLALAAIIVSVAILLGINKFTENAALADEDAMAQEALDIASKAQSWYTRPGTMGGGNNSFKNLSLEKLGVPSKNDNGEYSLDVLSGDKVKITGRRVEGNGVEVIVSPNSIKLTTFSNGGAKNTEVKAAAITANSLKEIEVDTLKNTLKTNGLSQSNSDSDSVKAREPEPQPDLKPKKSKRKKQYGLGAGCGRDERN
jgi:hypothetical protein